MNFTTIFCCYVLSPYFASLVSPPREAIICNAVGSMERMRRTGNIIVNKIKHLLTEKQDNSPVPAEASFKTLPVDENLNPKRTLEDKYFDQKRDHYHFNDLTKWPQRYLVNDQYYRGNGIIFLRIGTDKVITARNVLNGRWNEYCKKANALCIGIESRGYGASLPNGNLNDENLKYLNSDQALADVAWFIYNFRSLQTDLELPEKLKWVAHGEGKQGTLAAWLRMKYPHLVHATLSLSAPVLAKENFEEYFQHIERRMLSEEVYLKNEILLAYREIDNLVKHGEFEILGKIFEFCDEKLLVNEEKRVKNVDFMYITFAQTLAIIMRYGNDDLKFMKNKVIKLFLGQEKMYGNFYPISKFALFVDWISNIKEKGCLQIDYDVAISAYKKTTKCQALHYPLAQIFGSRATLYQSCNEFGNFQTMDQFFESSSVELSFYKEFCHAIFEERYYHKGQLEKGVRRTNVFYGGLNIVVSSVIFVYGDRDPFKELGIIRSTSKTVQTRYLIGARHCYEMDKLQGIPNLKNVMEEIYHQLIDWLQ